MKKIVCSEEEYILMYDSDNFGSDGNKYELFESYELAYNEMVGALEDELDQYGCYIEFNDDYTKILAVYDEDDEDITSDVNLSSNDAGYDLPYGWGEWHISKK